MKTALILLSLLSSNAFAHPDSELVKGVLEKQPACSRFVRFDDDNLYLGFGTNLSNLGPERKIGPQEVRVTPLAQPDAGFRLATDDSALDAVRAGDTLWVLTYTGLEEWDLAHHARVAIHPTTSHTSLEYKEHPTGMILDKNRLYIAHGRLGVSVFDTVARRLVAELPVLPSQSPRESMATAITSFGRRAYVAVDAFTLTTPGNQAFTGVAVVNLDSGAIERTLPGLDPGADAIVTDGKVLIVSFWGNPIWKYDLASLGGSKLPNPLARLYKFPVPGRPNATPALDSKYFYTCFQKEPAERGGRRSVVPAALDRRSWSL